MSSAAKGKGKGGSKTPAAPGGSSWGFGSSSSSGKDSRDTKDAKGNVGQGHDSGHVSEWEARRQDVRGILSSTMFDVAIGAVIALNAMTIGIEQTQTLNGDDTRGVTVVENFFLVIYVIELGMRFFGHGFGCLRDKSVKLDMLLVVLGVASSWILEPLMNGKPEEMGPLMLLRTARLMRLFKTARILMKKHEFWMLIRGLMTSVTLMGYILLVLLVVLYCFSSLGVALITKHSMVANDPDFRAHVDKYFASVPQTMLTLVQFITLDDLASVYKPLCEKDPWLSIYFVALVLVVCILLANLISAVIVCSTFAANQRERDAAQETQEKSWGLLIVHLKEMFNRLDEDKSGQLSLGEFMGVDKKDQKVLCGALQLNTPQEIFHLLDTERTGQVSINEFFDCILEKVLATGDQNLKRMERQIETMHWRLKETFSAQHEVGVAIKSLTQRVNDIWEVASPRSKGRPMRMTDEEPGATNSAQDEERSRASFVTLQSVDPEMALWEQEMARKLRLIVDDGVQEAFARLREVASDARGDIGAGRQVPADQQSRCSSIAKVSASSRSQPASPRSALAGGRKRSPGPRGPGARVEGELRRGSDSSL